MRATWSSSSTNERHEEDPDEPYEYGQLAALFVNGELDESDPEHLDLAREYLDDQGVLARKEALWVEFVRYGLAPGAMTGGRDAWAQGGILEQAAHFFPTDSPRREEFGCLIGACDAVLSRAFELDDEVLSAVVWDFNSAFDRALNDHQWRPPVPHRIALCGTLAELLAHWTSSQSSWEQGCRRLGNAPHRPVALVRPRVEQWSSPASHSGVTRRAAWP